jgi:endonuclease YncB( thermonuclease family)
MPHSTETKCSPLYLRLGGEEKHESTASFSGDQFSMSQQAGIIGVAPKAAIASFLGIANLIIREVRSLTFHQKTLFVATFAIGFCLGRIRPFWKRYTDVYEIPNILFGSSASSISGRAVSVSDGDTIRFLHTPTWFHPKTLRKGEKVSSVALPIRICTIDTPETAKFGKPGQPFGNEAKEHLKSLLEQKKVRIRLLQKDQYGRAVAEVFTGRFPIFRKYMDELMLKEGFAEVYQGGGTVYGPKGKDMYLEMEDNAKKAKKGIWSSKKRESAAEYKRRTK